MGYESWVERDALMALDADPNVVAVASQPMWLHWVDGTGKARRHAPDFFARLTDGTGVLIDVRPRERMTGDDITASTSDNSTPPAQCGELKPNSTTSCSAMARPSRSDVDL